MKQIRSGLMALALLVLAAPLAAQTGPQIVFINSQRVMAEAPGVAAARTQMQQEMQRLEQQIVPLRDEYQRMVEEFQQQQSVWTAERRRERQQAIGLKQQELQQRGAELDQQAQARQQELLEPVLERINDVIDAYREEQGYSFILDVAAGGVVAADPSLDITDEVLSRLRALAGRE